MNVQLSAFTNTLLKGKSRSSVTLKAMLCWSV